MSSDLLTYVQGELTRLRDPAKAASMQAYMKTDMPFYGVAAKERRALVREAARLFKPTSQREYIRSVEGLWSLPQREEKYVAVDYARRFKRYITPASLNLYRRMIVEGAWWDFVDEIAAHLIGDLLLAYPEEVWPTVDAWSRENDLWLRRSAIISQLCLKQATDRERLFGYCRANLHDKEFFIRKAIGWALRQYARTDPEAVRRFLVDNRADLSPLSFREAAKHLGKI